MTVVWNPNLLAVAGVMMTMAGLGLLARAVLLGSDGADSQHVLAQRRVSMCFAVPLGMLGLLVMGAAEVVSIGLTPFVVITMLALAFTLLMFAALESTLADRLVAKATTHAAPPRLALIAPRAEPAQVAVSLHADPVASAG